MTSRVPILCAILLASLPWSRPAAAADLDDAIALYAEASYEAALDALNAADIQADADLVDQYRALCFLALNRQLEAELSLARIVARSPLYRIDAGAVSPKIVDIFQQVRLRTLPTTAQELYAAAKAQYNRDELSEARLGFVRLGEVVQEASAIGAGDNLQDLVQLGEGFLVLIEARLAPPPAPPPPSEPVEAVSDPEVPEEGRIYSAADTNVVPPVSIERDVPTWVPPRGPFGQTTMQGSLVFVVDEHGIVEQAAMAEPMWPAYDTRLLAATRDWRFRPATLGGTPVKFQHVLNITLAPP